MRAAFIKNKYYTDSGIDYIFDRLRGEFAKFGITLETPKIFVEYGKITQKDYDFAVFWDKDIALARALERSGVRVFNRANAIEICDDKEKTFAALDGVIPLPKTIVSPLAYDSATVASEEFLKFVSGELKFPLVVKENKGSLGRQVYLVNNEIELRKIANEKLRIPHIYEEYIDGKFGCDTRAYVIGGKSVAFASRENTTSFKSNVAVGGSMTLVEATEELQTLSELIAAKIGLDYGSVDFIIKNNKPIFIESNSNAYFRAIESLGVNIARPLVKHILDNI